MPTTDTHFGHRESNGIVVDLFWNRESLDDEFRVEVEDRRAGACFVLHAATGRDAIQAFYHPFSAVGTARSSKARAAWPPSVPSGAAGPDVPPKRGLR